MAWMKLIYITHVFSHKVHQSFPALLGTLHSTSALSLGAISNSEKHKNPKNVVLNRSWKEHLFTVWELKQEGRVLLPYSTSAMTQIFCHSAYASNDCKSTASIHLDYGNNIWG